MSPIIKEVNADLSKMWFTQNNTDYIAHLSPSGITHIEKAVFGSVAGANTKNKQTNPKTKGSSVTQLPFEEEED